MTDPHVPTRSAKPDMRPAQPPAPVLPTNENHAFAPEAHMWHHPGPSYAKTSKQDHGSGYGQDSSPAKSYGLRQRVQTAKMVVEEDEDDERNSECTRLKGVYWPGMDIFDSATPEMRRKRNQKKDTSVLEQLEINSLEVDATEHMWSPSGTLQRSKFITGLASSSPFKPEPSPKRLRTNERPPLFDLGTDRTRRSERSFTDDHAIFEDEQLDLELTYGPLKRKRAFDIFQDSAEASFENPAPFNYLTSEFHYPGQQSYAAVPPSYNYKPYSDPFRYPPAYEEKPTQVRGTPYNEDEETLINGLYDPHSIFCPTASGYQPAQYYHGVLPQDYAGLYTSTQMHSAFQNFSQCAHQEQQYNEDEDDERTISAPPSEA